MTRQLVVAAGVGALGGAVVSVVAFVAVTFGVDIYFRAMGWRDMRRETKECV